MIPVESFPPLSISDAPPAAASAAGRFLVLTEVSVSRAGNRAACRVRLECAGTHFDGEAREPDTELGRARAAARATLAAVENAASRVSLGLEGLSIVEMFDRRYIALAIDAASGRRFASLAALVAVDPARSVEEAAALAALRATERWVTG